ncbi:hypothetical protein TrST_g14080 [Triparma strigata]|uniref:Uncharacterized protein n=1 Tax=Triparma strigata TaxID=1606541 RepID=A0A9W7DVU4_9STRA|nr:hypothetical protein TrST_g14080 [Triparma strigata]
MFLICFWALKVIQTSVRKEWQKDLNLSVEKIATMTEISSRRALAGVLTIVTGVCAMFLFSMTEVDSDVDSALLSRLKYICSITGFLGIFASIVIVISKIISSLKAQRRISESGSGVLGQRESASEEILVEECSGLFLLLSFLFALAFAGLYVIHAITLIDDFWLVANIMMPLAGTSFVLCFGMKPRRTDNAYMRFLYVHFATIFVLPSVAVSIAQLRQSEYSKGIAYLLSSVFWYLAFKQGLKLRTIVSKFSGKVLSEFLCHTILVRGSAGMGPMLFFSFEAASCFISEGLDVEECANTSSAAMNLSLYLAFLISISIAQQAVPENVRLATAWEYSAIATLEFNVWQKIQGALLSCTAMSALYLLAALGVKGDFLWCRVAGTIGSLCLGAFFLVRVQRLLYATEEVGEVREALEAGEAGETGEVGEAKEGDVEITNNAGARRDKGMRTASTSDIGDNMFFGGLV